MDAGFDRLKLGIANGNYWMSTMEHEGSIVDHFSDIVGKCFGEWGINFTDLTRICFLNGPGSTMGIRTICALIRTLKLLQQVGENAIYAANHLHFHQLYQTHIACRRLPFCMVARAGFHQYLCLYVNDKQKLNVIRKVDGQHLGNDGEIPLVKLPHPSLSKEECVDYRLSQCLPLLYWVDPCIWQTASSPDLYQRW
jgi:tRNA A37 threonylcarbamoyladenosine modification protein TsaB